MSFTKSFLLGKFLFLSRIIIFIPLILYFGERSPIAHDEGFYLLQAKWILDTGNWIVPLWWGDFAVDRTIAIQSLIALSQKIFGLSGFSTYLPITLSSAVMIFLTYEIHKKIIDKKNALISSLILSTTYIWINFSHMATQDIIYSSLITGGILSSINAFKENKKRDLFLSGAWIGLAFMFKTYLTIIPLIGILPFLFKSKILFKKYFWYGTFLGFLPFIFWSYKLITIYGYDIYSGIFKKFIRLSSENYYTKPPYYYFWNLPLNILPWSVFTFIGFLKAYNLKSNISKFFLFYYPITILFLLSLFSTKAPYYLIQLMPIIAINSYLGIIYLLKNKNKITDQLKNFIFLIIPIFLIGFLIYINSTSEILIFDKNQIYFINLGLLIFALSWIRINYTKNLKNSLILIVIGPYFLFSTIVQSSLLNDRSRDLRIASEQLVKNENLINHKVEFFNNEMIDPIAGKKIVKIALFMPRIGEGIDSINNLNSNEYAWTTLFSTEFKENSEYKIIDDSDIYQPWKLILKN